MQRTANPRTPVRSRLQPPYRFCLFFQPDPPILLYFIRHYTRLYWKNWFGLLQPFLFVCLVMLLFHLLLRDQLVYEQLLYEQMYAGVYVSAHEQRLSRALLPSLLFVCLLLGHLLSLDTLFKNYLVDGVLDYVFLSAQPLYKIIPAMIAAHWLNHGFLLTLLALPWILPGMITGTQVMLSVLVLLLFTANLTFIGSFTSALTAGIRENSLLLGLISLPLYVPNVLFSFAAYLAIIGFDDGSASLLFLVALFFFNMAILPWAVYFALTNSND